MRYALVFSLLLGSLVCFSGCSSNNKGQLEGTYWSSERMEYQGYEIPAGTLKLQFLKKDNKLQYKTVVGTFSGEYKLGWGDYVTLTFDKPLAGSKQHVEKIQVEGKRLTMTDTDGTTATFRLLSKY